MSLSRSPGATATAKSVRDGAGVGGLEGDDGVEIEDDEGRIWETT